MGNPGSGINAECPTPLFPSADADQSRKRTLLSILGIILFVLAIRQPLLPIPFERDEGEYAYIGWRLNFHELPYRDWVDQKPPGIFWIYQLALKLPMDSICAVHFAALIFSAATACALFLLARRFTSHCWALAAALLFALLGADPLLEATAANTELFMLLPLVLAQIAMLSGAAATDRRRGLLLAFCAGALTGIAVAFKQVALVNWPLLMFVFWFFAPAAARLRRTVWFAAWSTLGLAAVWGAIAVYFAYWHGFREFIYNVFTHNLEYANALPWSTRYAYFCHTLKTLAASQSFAWLLALAGLVAVGVKKQRALLVFLVASIAAGLAGVSASGYYFPHYFQQLLPIGCLAAALGAEWVEHAAPWKRLSVGFRRTILALALGLLPGIVLFPYLFEYSAAEAVGKIYPGNSFFANMPTLGQRLAAITKPADRVFIYGAEPELLFYARRISATRYIFLFPIYGPYSDAKFRQQATAHEITAQAPAAAFVLPSSFFFAPNTEQYFTFWSQDYLKQNFSLDTTLYLDPYDTCYSSRIPPNQISSITNNLRPLGYLLVRK
jgi:hypothetical protein